MIRPADWRDLKLVRRVSEQGICLDSQLAYTRGANTFQTMLLDLVTPGSSAYTLVARPSEDGEQAALGQILHRHGDPHARLTIVGPQESLAETIGSKLLDGLADAAGERGAHHLIAEVDEDNSVFESLRRAGYAIFARQRIWKLADTQKRNPPSKNGAWRGSESSDEEAISQLYLNLVPVMVQQVEVPPRPKKVDFVHYAEGELLGYLDIERGPRGVWVQPYLHPAAQSPAELLTSFIEDYSDNRKRPLYFNVRSYQGGVMHGLERLGFIVHRDQAVMVKRLAALVRHPALKPIPAVDGTRPEATIPFAQFYGLLMRAEWASIQSIPPFPPQTCLPQLHTNETSRTHAEREPAAS